MKKLRDIFPLKVSSFVLNKDGKVSKKPLSFKNGTDFFINKEGYAVPKEPIHFKSDIKGRPKKISEEVGK